MAGAIESRQKSSSPKISRSAKPSSTRGTRATSVRKAMADAYVHRWCSLKPATISRETVRTRRRQAMTRRYPWRSVGERADLHHPPDRPDAQGVPGLGTCNREAEGAADVPRATVFSVEQREDIELVRAVVEVHFPLVRARSRLELDLRRDPVATAERTNRDGAAVLQGRIANDERHLVAAHHRRDRVREGRSAVGANALVLADRLVL